MISANNDCCLICKKFSSYPHQKYVPCLVFEISFGCHHFSWSQCLKRNTTWYKFNKKLHSHISKMSTLICMWNKTKYSMDPGIENTKNSLIGRNPQSHNWQVWKAFRKILSSFATTVHYKMVHFYGRTTTYSLIRT